MLHRAEVETHGMDEPRIGLEQPLESRRGDARALLDDGQAKTVEELRLLGQPPLHDHLDFVRKRVVGGADLDPAELVNDWRRANDRYYDLAEQEAGFADEIDIQDLPPALDQLLAATKADFRYRNTFNRFPTSFAMVELDRLVVYQTHVAHEFSRDLAARLGPDPDPAMLFQFCHPERAENPPVEIRELGDNRYVFSSDSTDFRQHEPVLLRPEQVHDHQTFGPLSAMVGLGIGFGSNFLTAIRADNRLLLHNGYHRACALRLAGVTHAPCIVQTVTRRDELEVAAKNVVADHPEFYFSTPRPPLLKDFFDEQIAQIFTVYRTKKMIEVTFDIKTFEVRA